MNRKWYRAEIIQTAPSGDCDPVSIVIEDAESGLRVCEIAMTLEEFGKMLHAPTTSTCRVRFGPVEKMGWTREVREQVIPTEGYITRTTDKDAILAPYEVDGWRGTRSDLGNSHRRTKDGYVVGFHRFVPPTGATP